MRTAEEEEAKVESFIYVMKWTIFDCAVLAAAIMLADWIGLF